MEVQNKVNLDSISSAFLGILSRFCWKWELYRTRELGSSPTREVMFHSPIASLKGQGMILWGFCHLANTHFTRPLPRLLWVVGPHYSGPIMPFQSAPGHYQWTKPQGSLGPLHHNKLVIHRGDCSFIYYHCFI